MRTNNCFVGWLGVLAVMSLLGCDAPGSSEPGGAAPEVAQQGLRMVMEIDATTGISGMNFEILPVSCDDGAPLPGGETIDVDLPLSDLLLPGGVPELEGNPLAGDAAHAFADYFTMLAVGCYDVTTTPATVDGVICHPAHVAGVVVLEGETTEVFLLTQCEGQGAGAIDALAAANHPPVLLEVAFATSKFELVCADQVVCATAQDPDSDPVEFVWTWLDGAQIQGPLVDSLIANDDGSTTECIRFLPEAAGRTMLSVLVYDLLDNNGAPQRVEDWLLAQGYPSESHASLEFPSYAIACGAGEECAAGECVAVPEGCPPGLQDNDLDGECLADCANSGRACEPNGVCTDASGTALCACDPDYVDDGVTCVLGWVALGAQGFAPRPYELALVGLDDAVYLAYTDPNGQPPSTVVELDGAAWVDADLQGTARYRFSTAVHQGAVYWAGDGAVRWLDGDVWTPLADYGGEANQGVRLASDGADLYIAYLHALEGVNAYNRRIGVKRYNPATLDWDLVGYAPGEDLGVWAFGGYHNLQLAVEAGVPYVYFTQASGPANSDTNNLWTVLSYTGGAWAALGATEVAASVYGDHIAVLGGVPYVSNRFGSVWRYSANAGAWETLPGVSLREEPALSVYAGELYVLGALGGQLALYKYTDDAWQLVGIPSTLGDALWGSASLWIGNGSAYVAYQDGDDGGRLSAMSLLLP